jgi:hypothetical protein
LWISAFPFARAPTEHHDRVVGKRERLAHLQPRRRSRTSARARARARSAVGRVDVKDPAAIAIERTRRFMRRFRRAPGSVSTRRARQRRQARHDRGPGTKFYPQARSIHTEPDL